ncbi:SAM-dependent methyltransferase [Kitasatospora sp. LaBMicrA B282]|uniref:SAM-dependent methyltransferase n=1 Tax=Kitasatospora sp. LaBMicrA B282 TaxID=3420949 RepID=UPI003D1043D2
MDDRYQHPFDGFPTRRAHEDRWIELAAAITATRHQVAHEPAAAAEPVSRKGELVVLGSGIEAAGFTRADERILREADQVLYCVADPVTVLQIKAWRPDAYDLYVLYDDTKERYLTYVQMTEAVLHFVRAGQKVAAVFYGHPGLFVLSSHRAVRIARREGHRAVMRPGISALDVLCADLGVDPSTPGMQTFEATDLLLRGRRIDPGLHLVLWQVGLVGELGYQRNGFFNSRLPVLLDYLEAVYGSDQTVVNYTGARYPGIDPVVDRRTIAELRSPDAQSRVTGASTWYLPPAVTAPADPRMLERLGLLQPGRTIRATEAAPPQRDAYGPRELAAFDDFADFRVPSGYHWQEDTAAGRFLLALGQDSGLRDRFTRDPVAALREWSPGELTEAERALLARREDLAMHAAAKGLQRRPDAHTARLLRTLLSRKTVARSLLAAVRDGSDPRRGFQEWRTADGQGLDPHTIRRDLDALLAESLFPWTGLYCTADGDRSLYLLGRAGDPRRHRLYLDGQQVARPSYQHGVLRWRAEDGNPCSGELRCELTRRWERRLIGAVWPAGQPAAKEFAVRFQEHPLPAGPPPADLVGRYRATDAAGREVLVEVAPEADEPAPRVRVTVDGAAATAAVTLGTAAFEVDGVTVPFAAAVAETTVPPYLHGTYLVRLSSDGGGAGALELRVDGAGLALDGRRIPQAECAGKRLGWYDGPAVLPQASLTLLLDPVTLHPMLHGTGSTSDGARLTLMGMVPVAPEDAERLAGRPQFAVPARPWSQLTALAAATSRTGGLFWWHGWEQSATALRTVHQALWEADL